MLLYSEVPLACGTDNVSRDIQVCLRCAGAMPGAEQDERGLKRKAHEAAGPSIGGAEAGPKRSATLAAVTACAAGRMEAQLQGFAGVEAPATTAAAPTVGNPQADQAGSADGGPAQEPAPSSLPNGGLDVQMAADGPGALNPLQWCHCATMASILLSCKWNILSLTMVQSRL